MYYLASFLKLPLSVPASNPLHDWFILIGGLIIIGVAIFEKHIPKWTGIFMTIIALTAILETHKFGLIVGQHINGWTSGWLGLL